jgi:hypothetical protein
MERFILGGERRIQRFNSWHKAPQCLISLPSVRSSLETTVSLYFTYKALKEIVSHPYVKKVHRFPPPLCFLEIDFLGSQGAVFSIPEPFLKAHRNRTVPAWINDARRTSTSSHQNTNSIAGIPTRRTSCVKRGPRCSFQRHGLLWLKAISFALDALCKASAILCRHTNTAVGSTSTLTAGV